ncbi:DUF6077 domain-containing protein [Micromonospora coxensis]|uniref:4-amino-4-deoxy-L-arabinose transferase n=1 Tax=Micromonospora coxensis TaxID=356852 RepID=A0A1C5JQI1_9ACTN|nr:DUF6077 domain-containing protein [Micromonospora coxensis]SCG72768.1 hypothetical protein GA0070614_5066 [Micromonospora coxensis]
MPHVEHVAVAPPGSGPRDSRPTAGRSDTTGPRSIAARLRSLLAAIPVLVTDAGVVAFALWTLLYHLNLVLDLRPSVVFAAWVVTSVIAAGVAWWLGVRRAGGAPHPDAADTADAADADPAGESSTTGWGPLLRRYALPVGAGLAGVLLAAYGSGTARWAAAIVLGLVAIVSAWPSIRLRGGSRTPSAPAVPTDTPGPATTPVQALVVIAAALAAAYYSTRIARVSLDDVFYVGKSVWVAERDEIPYRDFLLTEGVLPAGSANPPIPSFEVFIGALARALGVHAASATWYLMLPLLAVGVAFALWRICQRWAPRRALLVFAVAATYIVFVAGHPDAYNTYHLPRLTQGKSVFLHALVPLAWVYLTDYLETRSRRALVLLALLSVGAVGLTTTAVILLPLLAAAAAFAILVVTRRLRDALLCFAAASVYPLGSGIVTRLTTSGIDQAVATYAEWREPQLVWMLSLWLGILGVVGGLALWWSPLLLRRGAPRLLAAGAALAVTVLLLPGVISVASDLTGLGAVLWRVPWIVPLPVLVGVLATLCLPRLKWPNRALAVALPGALVAVFVTAGTPMWSADVYQPEPSWRMPEVRKNVTFWIVRQDRPEGLVLAPSSVMRAMPQVTSRVRVVLARDLYLTDYGLDTQFAKDRLLLATFADGQEPVPVDEVAAAMRRVGVGTVCLWRVNKLTAAAVPELKLERFASRKSPGGMICYRAPTAGQATGGN